MEDQNLQKKGGSMLFPILIIAVLFIADLVLAYVVLNPDKLWKSKYFPIDTTGENIFSYGITQQLYLDVVDIQDFEDHNGQKGKQFIFNLELDNGENKRLEKYVISPDGNLDEFNKTLMYWNPAAIKWLSYDDRPENVYAGINVGDRVTVTYKSYYEKGVQDISVNIQTVEHRPEVTPQVPNEQ